MKSQLFSKFDPSSKENDEFATDFARLISLPDKALSACIDSLPDLLLAKTETRTTELYDRLHEQTGQSYIDLRSSVFCMEFLTVKSLESDKKSDTPEAWADDLRGLKIIDSDDLERKFVALAERLKREIAPQYELQLRRREFAKGVLPSIKSMGTTVELRAVQRDKYKIGENFDNYKSKIEDVVGVISVHITTDSGSFDDFHFQASEEELEYLIDTLRAALDDLESLKSFKSPERGP